MLCTAQAKKKEEVQHNVVSICSLVSKVAKKKKNCVKIYDHIKLNVKLKIFFKCF